MHLVSQTEGVHGEGEAGRLTPRLEKNKIMVKRDDLLKSAENALANNVSSRFVYIGATGNVKFSELCWK